MIIKKLHIENFGKLSNFDFELSDNINEIYKENGWGKSTLTAFIKAMFYSLPARARGEDFKYERPRFSPWQGGRYGGFLEYESEGKLYRITRYFEKTPENDFFELKDLQTNKIITYENERLGDSLFGLGRESFEVTALFPQLNFVSLSTIQITANLTGLNKFQNDIENLDKAVKILDSRIYSVKKEKPRKEECANFKRKIIENESFISDEKLRREDLKNQIEDVKQEEIEQNLKLVEESKQFDLQSQAFNQKLSLQDNLAKENEKLNQILSETNELKDQKLDQRGKNGNKRIKYLIPIPFALVAMILIIFTLVGVVSLLIGILTGVGVVALAVGGEFVIIKLKRDKNISANIKELDRKIKNKDEEGKLVQKNIGLLNEQLKLFATINNPDRQNLDEVENTLTQTRLKKVTLENEITNITDSIDRLIEINEKLQNDYDATIEKIDMLDEKIETLQMTKDYLLSAKDNVSKRFIVPVNDKLKNVLSKFNFENRDFVVDTSWKVKENTNYGMKDFEYSSQGFQDIISFCQRINLIQEVYKKEKPIIILDDTFVNLDDANLEVAKGIVKEISKDYQILYICCNERCMITK